MAEWAAQLAALPGRARLSAAFILGALSVLSLPPVLWLPVLPVAWTGFAWLLDGAGTARARAATGWAFGFGYLSFGLYWISAALFTDIAKYWWMVPLAVTALPAALALFWGLAAALAGLAPARSLPRYLAIVLAFTAVEWLRGTVLTGFPWNLPGYAWLAAPAVMQGAALISTYGLTLLAIALGASLACLAYPALSRGTRLMPLIITLGIVLSLAGWGQYRLARNPTTYHDDLVVRLVQPNTSVAIKRDLNQRQDVLNTLISLSKRPPAIEGGAKPTIVIWPESAVPYRLARDEVAREAAALAAPDDGYLIAGTTHMEGDGRDLRQTTFYNSIVGIDHRANLVGRYDKVKLVPFGEFLPFRDMLRPLGIDAIAAGSVDFSPGHDQRLEAILPATLPQPLALICYEIIFPGWFDRQVPGAGWIVNVTNDAWFGETAGPHQHFAMARARAIETGLPVVRVANTGISGVIDPLGRVLVQSGLYQTAVLDLPLPRRLDGIAQIQPRLPVYGFAALLLVTGGLLVLACARRWREQS